MNSVGERENEKVKNRVQTASKSSFQRFFKNVERETVIMCIRLHDNLVEMAHERVPRVMNSETLVN